ncbi:ligase-associated DNA damage response DEXH box helicase [Sphingobacterium sp. lm-10]|uniref:ligase-associated DNA damage response DEXH box helicase n=1 Tax=Sphingobacterium sp. lm-10 TaxID=2944904 RepID=UPI00202145AC|nr:ligase-associated DNA damage response DEXH box helicase [Sphingobacterium sp. lm-10]MCL7986934.1 ligase-associated DNA damage response DEXH box helicase [Sphingobacterium sp. lm-10]
MKISAKNIGQTDGYGIITSWMAEKGNRPFSFQEKTWAAYASGKSGMVVAPTGFGKTFSVFLAVLQDFMNQPDSYRAGLKLIWITPIRSLAKDLARAMQEAIDEIGLDWVVDVRNGDTDVKRKQQQSKQMPDVLLVTPESLHLLLAQKARDKFFKSLRCVAVDEWHELLGTKRGVMVELALAYLRHSYGKLRIWGITATIGNLDQALDVLIPPPLKSTKIVATEKKIIEIQPVFPDEVEVLPWAGHMGGKLVEQVVPIILASRSTIVFTNTRGQSEMWYQLLLEAHPDFAGQIALHHGSIDGAIREWIEDALSEGKLKAVVSTSSLDLGVDFKPVDTVIQIGSSKGVARFMQRAGRSGHSPFEVSKIYVVPTHSLELIEVAALKEAVKSNTIESRDPMVQTFDVLVQFLVTIALGGGFRPADMMARMKDTHAFSYLTEEEWAWCLFFITRGGQIGANYEEFHKVVENEEGLMVVTKRRIAMLHRMNLGVIVSEAMMRVRFTSGGYIGMIEEYFISKLKAGEKFILAGRVLELVRIKEMTTYVRLSSGKAITPSWLGGRLPLSSNLSHFLRQKLARSAHPSAKEQELRFLHPLFARQKNFSHIPNEDEFLVELIVTKEGYHLFMYPFEGRLIHEVMAALMAYRISRYFPITFSMAMNDYGFELFSDTEISLSEAQVKEILSADHLMEDVLSSINSTEMAKRKFRDIAVISGMVIQTFPGAQKNNKSLQSSSGIIFQVLEDHDPQNLLLRQAYTEVFNQQLEEPRLQSAFKRINSSKIIFKFATGFTPLSFPIKVDSMRQSLSSEDLATRIRRMQESGNKPGKRRR